MRIYTPRPTKNPHQLDRCGGCIDGVNRRQCLTPQGCPWESKSQSLLLGIGKPSLGLSNETTKMDSCSLDFVHFSVNASRSPHPRLSHAAIDASQDQWLRQPRSPRPSGRFCQGNGCPPRKLVNILRGRGGRYRIGSLIDLRLGVPPTTWRFGQRENAMVIALLAFHPDATVSLGDTQPPSLVGFRQAALRLLKVGSRHPCNR